MIWHKSILPKLLFILFSLLFSSVFVNAQNSETLETDDEAIAENTGTDDSSSSPKKFRPPVILWNNIDVKLKLLENGNLDVEESYSIILDGPVRIIERPFNKPTQSTLSVTNFYLYRPFAKENPKQHFTAGDSSIVNSYQVESNKISWRVDQLESTFNKTPLSFVINYTLSKAMQEKDGIWYLNFQLLPPRKNELIKYFQLKTEIHPNWLPIDPIQNSYIKTNLYPGIDFYLTSKFKKKVTESAKVSSELILTCTAANTPWEKLISTYFRGIPDQYLKREPEAKVTLTLIKKNDDWFVKSSSLDPIPNLTIAPEEEQTIGAQTTDLYLNLYLEYKKASIQEINDVLAFGFLGLANNHLFREKSTAKMSEMEINQAKYANVELSTSPGRITVTSYKYKVSVTAKDLVPLKFSPLSYPQEFTLLIHQTPTVNAVELPLTLKDCKTIEL